MRVSNLFSLEGKVVLITGGAGYLGSAMTEGFLEFGATVYIASRNVQNNQQFISKLNESGFSKVFTVDMDVTNSSSVQNAVNLIIEYEGKIDVLVNNAYSGKTGELLTGDEQDWLDSFNGSIHATYRVTKAVLPIMLKYNQGSIINISSMYGIVSPNPEIYADSSQNNPPQYGAAKAGIGQFTRYIAGHFAQQGVRANCISPGPFPNEKTQHNIKFINELSKKNPMQRIGKPNELKGVAILLASDSSSYINGQTISVDGGWTIW